MSTNPTHPPANTATAIAEANTADTMDTTSTADTTASAKVISKIYLHAFDTLFGNIRTAATDRSLVMIDLPGETDESFRRHVTDCFKDSLLLGGGPINEHAEREILAYLRGDLRTFTVPLDLRATPFQIRVLNAVAAIPYGTTRTYSEIATLIGSPKAARAVGAANARNPLPLIIPCHRVVSTIGLGGYGGGLPMKQRLLEMEQKAL